MHKVLIDIGKRIFGLGISPVKAVFGLFEYNHGVYTVISKSVIIVNKPIELILSGSIDIVAYELLIVTKGKCVGFIRLRRSWNKTVSVGVCLIKYIVLLKSQVMFSHIVLRQIAPHKFC